MYNLFISPIWISTRQKHSFLYCYIKKIHIKTSFLNHVINAGAGDRPKDTRGKKTKTKIQFKREFLKSEDAAKKDNLVSPPGARLSLLLWTFISLTFMNYFHLFLSPANSNRVQVFSCNRCFRQTSLRNTRLLLFVLLIILLNFTVIT